MSNKWFYKNGEVVFYKITNFFKVVKCRQKFFCKTKYKWGKPSNKNSVKFRRKERKQCK